MSVPSVADGSFVLLSHDPGDLIGQAARLDLPVTGVIDPDSVEGRILEAMCGIRECAICRICDTLTIVCETLPEPHNDPNLTIKDHKITKPDAITDVLLTAQRNGGRKAEPIGPPSVTRDMQAKEHLRLLIARRVARKLGTGADLASASDQPSGDIDTRYARREEGQS